MKLGVVLLLLAAFERAAPAWLEPALAFGRAPFLHHVLHLPLMHTLAHVKHYFCSGIGNLTTFTEKMPPGASLFPTYLRVGDRRAPALPGVPLVRRAQAPPA